jgi:hypothetical protein
VCTGQADGGAGTCQACGGANQPCCPGQTACTTGLTCVVSPTGDVCATACGASGQICCGNNNNGTCNAGLGCAGRNAGQGAPGMCATCGGSGQVCCSTVGVPADAGITACMTPLACIVATGGNQCGTCGASGQACCGQGNNGTCNAGLVCTGRARGTGMPGSCGAIPDAGPADAPAGQ